MTGRALIVGGAASGTGKTTVTAGILRAFRNRGLKVRALKAGPDYIDPAFHAVASGAPCANLDSWAMDGILLDTVLAEATHDADLVVVEAAMGLFDGLPGPAGRSGRASDLAARYGLPVILVLDVGGQAQTAAAIARGLASHDPAVNVVGVVLNRNAGERHHDYIAREMAAVPIRVFGSLSRSEQWAFPSRHLGLVQAEEHPDLDDRLNRLAAAVEASVDLDAVFAAAALLTISGLSRIALQPPGRRIAVASDAAFSFIYPHVLSGWQSAGAEVHRFSPLADEPPLGDCDCVWLPGGYPELHAGKLAAARCFHDGLIAFAATRPVHGECGGYMVLGEWIEDASGVHHAMSGLLGHGTSFAARRLKLGYREARLAADGVLGKAGTVIRGHEFHYSSVVQSGDDAPFATVIDGRGEAVATGGGRRGNVSGTWFHAIAAV